MAQTARNTRSMRNGYFFRFLIDSCSSARRLLLVSSSGSFSRPSVGTQAPRGRPSRLTCFRRRDATLTLHLNLSVRPTKLALLLVKIDAKIVHVGLPSRQSCRLVSLPGRLPEQGRPTHLIWYLFLRAISGPLSEVCTASTPLTDHFHAFSVRDRVETAPTSPA